LVMPRVSTTVKPIPLLGTPEAETTTFPVVAPVGTVVTMLIALQLVGVASVPLKLTVPVPSVEPKFVPVIVTEVPTTPEVTERLVIFGADANVKATALLDPPIALTITFPVVAPDGTGTAMVDALQLVGAAAVPLKVTDPVPWVAPKFAPAMATSAPTAPTVGDRLVILGA
jgi:hypothetical protein